MFAREMGPKYLQPVFFKVEKLYMKLGNVFLYHGDNTCAKFTIKTQGHCSHVLIVDFEQVCAHSELQKLS